MHNYPVPKFNRVSFYLNINVGNIMLLQFDVSVDIGNIVHRYIQILLLDSF